MPISFSNGPKLTLNNPSSAPTHYPLSLAQRIQIRYFVPWFLKHSCGLWHRPMVLRQVAVQTLAPLRLNGDQLPEAAKFLTALTAFVMHRVLHADQGLGALMQDDVEIQRRLDCVGNIAQLDAEKILAMIYEEAQTEAQTQQQLNQCANSYAAIKAATNLY